MGSRPRRRGFTLVEMLVVMGIIAILAGILLPAIMAARRKAQEAATQTLINQCEIAATAFFNDYGDYPPSTWAELDEFLDVELDIFQVDDNALDTYVWPTTQGPFPRPHPWVSGLNEGIEVFLACVASQGSAYIDVDAGHLANTDADFDRDNGDVDLDDKLDIHTATNWVFGGSWPNNPQPVYELVDYWGNPLVYFHNRDYRTYDRTSPGYGGAAAYYAWPEYATWDTTVDPAEVVSVDDAEGTTPVYSVSTSDLNVAPQLQSYQLYSWGLDGQPGYYDGNTTEKRDWRDNLKNWED